jgi:KTSC domain
MNRTIVESTSLAAVAYDDARELLRLEFRSRAIYQYFHTRVNAFSPPVKTCSQECEHGTHECVRHGRIRSTHPGRTP